MKVETDQKRTGSSAREAARHSFVDIVQSACRCMRKDEAQPNKIGYIMVPVFIEDEFEDDLEDGLGGARGGGKGAVNGAVVGGGGSGDGDHLQAMDWSDNGNDQVAQGRNGNSEKRSN